MADVYAEKKEVNNQINVLKKTNNLKDSLAIVSKLNLQKVNLEVNEQEKNQKESRNYSFYLILILGIIAAALLSVFIWKNKIFDKKTKSVSNSETATHYPNKTEVASLSVNELFDLAVKNDHSFYYQFRKTFPDFDKKLLAINSTVKVSDIKFCAFIKLNLDTKQIATIKKMTIGAVEAKKYRIRRKLNISSEENMGIWISRF